MKRRQTSGKRKTTVKAAASKRVSRTSLITPPEFPLGGAKLVARPSFILPEPPVPQPPSSITPAPSRSFFRSQASVEYTNTYAELLEALAAEKVQITLGNDIIAKDNIVINHDVAINFNGHSLISDRSSNDMRLLDIRRGEVTLTGEGKIFVMGSNGVAIRLFGAISSGMPNYTNLTIDEKIHIYAPDGSGILISPNLGAAYGVNLTFRGEIVARSGICLSQGVRGLASTLPEIHIKNGSRIIADEMNGAAIEAAGVGVWHIGAAKLFGINGLRIRHGSASINHTQILATDSAIQIDSNAATNLDIEIDGGKYISETNFAITGSALAIENFIIKSGEFCGVRGAIADDLSESISVWEENFSNNVPAMLQSLETDRDWNLTFTQEIPTMEPVTTIQDVTLDTLPTPEAPSTSVLALDPSNNQAIFAEPLDSASGLTEDEMSSTESFTDEFELTDEPITDDEPELVMDEISEEIEDNIENFVMVDEEDDFEFTNEVFDSEQSNPIGERSIFALPEPIHPPAWTPPPAPTPPVIPPVPIAVTPVAQSEPTEDSLSDPSAVAERDALRAALELAISDMRSLRAEDYESGFEELTEAVLSAEMLLSDPEAGLSEILDATTDLLNALDQLVENEDSTMTDTELDQLFYHGAVLKEAAQSHQPEPNDDVSMNGELYNNSGTYPEPNLLSQPINQPVPQSEYQFANQSIPTVTYQPVYQPSSQPLPYQASISQYTANRLRQQAVQADPTSQLASPRYSHSSILDESTPTQRWSTGVTSIDESSPYAYERFHQGHYSVRRPKSGFSKFFKGVSAGFQAGIDTFRKTRQSLH